ncbi:pentatricopeptide repeat protein [Aspergillus mulundensis]|uniref:Pentatricopeptide repeat protein n=1 Tax=Aspergillus mulundensis TaxID=1810919 RepID=A0A3D8Q5I4_9EURO|nr:hypothetical protein DSM5745_11563 [Aspergillus mulundensis]RDW57081.1 hypothetical protein DSM5745_11563 [Aspergillus mulundensis]
MPQPNKSQSPPHLRSLPAQGSSRGLPSDPEPMRHQASFLSNASVRRIGSSPRARPVATSVADIFIRSLVVAGYCHEHSPRSRGISTTSAKTSWGSAGNRALGRGRRLAPAKHLPKFINRIESFGLRRPKTQRIFTSTVAQRVEVPDSEDNRINDSSTPQSSHATPVNYARLNRPSDPNSASRRLQHEHTSLEPSPHNIASHEDRKHVTSRATDHEVSNEENPVRLADRTESYKSAAKRLYHDTAEVFKELLGDKGWEEATLAAAAFDPFPPRFDNSQSSVNFSTVRQFEEHIADKSKSNHFLFSLYRELPSPGVKHLSRRSRGLLLRRFANPPDCRWIDSRRYLALVEDMLAANYSMSRSLWSSAIYLAGRSSGNAVTKGGLIRAIGVWNQMEHLAGIRSDSAVFTILFTTAIKAGQYSVAERFVEEMAKRKIQFDRMGKISNIFYRGVIGDADGVCRAFDEYINTGELVDTAVMNCLMTSLLNAGEPGSAMQVYQRLLQTRSETRIARQGLTADLVAYRKFSKKTGRVFQASASLKSKLPQHHSALQEALPTGPDTRTFHILLAHHAHKSGDLNAFESVLMDMEKTFAVPPRGLIFLLLFEGFARHGRRNRGWTVAKLRMVWRAYLRDLYESKIRTQHQSFALPPNYVWHNPLRDDGTATPSVLMSSSTELYMPLPFATTEASQGQEEHQPSVYGQEERQSSVYGQEERQSSVYGQEEPQPSIYGDDDLYRPDLDVDFYLQTGPAQPRPREEETVKWLEYRIENGVFLGRRMIIIILRAFGACCGPDDIMEVWLRMEGVWQPEKRRGLDVLAVKEELEYQMNRARRRVDFGKE